MGDNLMDEKNTTITVKQQPKLKKNKESNDRNCSNECNEHITCIIDDDDINDIDSSDDEGAFNFAAKPSKSSTNLAAESKTNNNNTYYYYNYYCHKSKSVKNTRN